jgi:small-conductance mechanosensitive channel
LYNGAFTQSGFARVAKRALDPRNGGKAVIEDYTAYTPSAFVPQMFAAVPIIADGETIGVFIAQIDIRALNDLLTDNNGWRSTGLGETGEVLLTGEDRLMRSQSRFMIESPDKFLAQVQAYGLPASIANQIRAVGTTILYMPHRSEAIEQSFRNRTGLARYLDYRGAVRTAETAFALTGLYLLLRVAQASLMSLVDEQMRAPKLLLDILRIGLSLGWGSVVVSRIWNVNLASLLAAMGVGSIALAFALQEFLGNLLSGLGLLSAHKFSIGDWIVVDGKAAEVVEMDWRTVTLVTAGGNRVVVANSTLAKGNLTIAARAREKASVTVPLALEVDIPPEQVRDAVIEAGHAVPNPAEPDGVKCFVTGIGDGTIKRVSTFWRRNDWSLAIKREAVTLPSLSDPATCSISSQWPRISRGLRVPRTSRPIF